MCKFQNFIKLLLIVSFEKKITLAFPTRLLLFTYPTLSRYLLSFEQSLLSPNKKLINRKKIQNLEKIRCGNSNLNINTFIETLPNGVEHLVVYKKIGSLQNTKKFIVPKDHYFLLGDNRDCSKDSRYLESVGYVNSINLVGKASVIFFSNDTIKSSLIKFWNIHKSFRLDRLFKKL